MNITASKQADISERKQKTQTVHISDPILAAFFAVAAVGSLAMFVIAASNLSTSRQAAIATHPQYALIDAFTQQDPAKVSNILGGMSAIVAHPERAYVLAQTVVHTCETTADHAPQSPCGLWQAWLPELTHSIFKGNYKTWADPATLNRIETYSFGHPIEPVAQHFYYAATHQSSVSPIWHKLLAGAGFGIILGGFFLVLSKRIKSRSFKLLARVKQNSLPLQSAPSNSLSISIEQEWLL